jgi:hypothetical protein
MLTSHKAFDVLHVTMDYATIETAVVAMLPYVATGRQCYRKRAKIRTLGCGLELRMLLLRGRRPCFQSMSEPKGRPDRVPVCLAPDCQQLPRYCARLGFSWIVMSRRVPRTSPWAAAADQTQIWHHRTMQPCSHVGYRIEGRTDASS